MSRLGNEDVRKTAGGILANLVESENLKIKKSVLTDLRGTVETKILEEAVEPTKEPEGANDPVPGEGKEPLKEEEPVEEIEAGEETVEEIPDETAGNDMTDDIAKATELIAKIFAGEVTPEEKEAARAELTDMIAGEAEPTEEVPEDEVEVGEEIVEEGANCAGRKKDKKLKEEDEDKIDEKIVEGLRILDTANNAFLLKESAGFIVGKNFNKSTGLIEEAETYKTEKIARKAFERISEKKLK